MTPDTLLNEREAAKRLSISVKTLQRWRTQGGGPVFRKLGRAVRYAQSDLAEFVEASAHRTTGDPRPGK